MTNTTGLYPRLKVDTTASAAVGQAGGVLLTETITASRLGREPSEALSRWRKPPSGKAVPTSYRLDGQTLIQTVAHAGFTYPIVADPTVSYGWGVYYHLSRAETAAYASYGFTGIAGVTAACYVIGNLAGPIGGVVVGAACAYVIGPFLHSATVAEMSLPKKCVYMRMLFPGVDALGYTSGTEKC